jgi:hypothetical protein
MVSEATIHGWYYKQNGQTIGPLSTGQLRELLGSGQLPARHVVWHQRQQRLLFVRAATAAADTSCLLAGPTQGRGDSDGEIQETGNADPPHSRCRPACAEAGADHAGSGRSAALARSA